MWQPDTSALGTLLDVGRIFGFCPWDYGFSHRSKPGNLAIVNVANASIATWHLASARFILFNPKGVNLEGVVFGMANSIATCSFLMENNGYNNYWKAFMDNIRRLDRGERCAVRRKTFYLKLLAFHVVVIFLLSVWSAFFIYTFRSSIGSMSGILISIVITTYKALWTSLVMRHVADMLSSRYSRMKRELKTKNITSEGIRAMQGKVVILFETVQVINVMLGRSILLLIAMTFFKCCYVFLLNAPKQMGTWMQPVQYFGTFCNCCLAVVLALMIVIGWDKVKTSHENLLITANTTLPHITHYTTREELILLMAHLENLPTGFTAAGVFALDRKLILSFINVLVTQLIVIAQLKRKA